MATLLYFQSLVHPPLQWKPENSVIGGDIYQAMKSGLQTDFTRIALESEDFKQALTCARQSSLAEGADLSCSFHRARAVWAAARLLLGGDGMVLT